MSSSDTNYYKQRIELASRAVAAIYKYPTVMKKALLKVKLKEFKILTRQAEKIIKEAESIEKED